MSMGLTGGLVGLVIGFFGFIAIRKLADRIEQSRPGADGRRTADLMRSVAIVDLLLFTGVGYAVGHFLLTPG